MRIGGSSWPKLLERSRRDTMRLVALLTSGDDGFWPSARPIRAVDVSYDADVRSPRSVVTRSGW